MADQQYANLTDEEFHNSEDGHLENAKTKVSSPVEDATRKNHPRLSKLTPTHGGEMIFGELDVSHCNLPDLEEACSNHLLHILNASNNSISDMTPVQHLKELVVLNLSSNNLIDVFKFPSLMWLQDVNMSNNNISLLPDLGDFLLLTILNLDDNMITSLEGLNRCHNLRHLSVRGNQLRHSRGLENLRLTRLKLSGNKLSSTVSLGRLPQLRQLQISCNRLRQLDGIDKLPQLRQLDCRNNPQLQDIAELRHLLHLPQLILLDMRGCAVCQNNHYQIVVLIHARHMQRFDGRAVSTCRREVALRSVYVPPGIDAAYDQSSLAALRLSQPVLLTSQMLSSNQRATTPIDNWQGSWTDESDVSQSRLASVPFSDIGRWSCVAIVGPLGSHREMLAHCLATGELSHYFHHAHVYTDMTKVDASFYSSNDKNGSGSITEQGHWNIWPFVHVERHQFRELREGGQFAATFSQFDCQLAISEHSIYEARIQGKILLVHCDLIASLSLSRRLPDVQMFLVLPLTDSVHRQRLNDIEELSIPDELFALSDSDASEDQVLSEKINSADQINPMAAQQGGAVNSLERVSSTPTWSSDISSCDRDNISFDASSPVYMKDDSVSSGEMDHDTPYYPGNEQQQLVTTRKHTRLIDKKTLKHYMTPFSSSTEDESTHTEDHIEDTMSESVCSGRLSWEQFPLQQECSGWTQDKLVNITSHHDLSTLPSALFPEPDASSDQEGEKGASTPCMDGSLTEGNQDISSQKNSGKKMYSQAQIDCTMGKRDLYLRYHWNNPGLFRCVINTDSVPDACQHLNHLLSKAIHASSTSGQQLQKQDDHQLLSKELRTSPAVHKLHQNLTKLYDQSCPV